MKNPKHNNRARSVLLNQKTALQSIGAEVLIFNLKRRRSKCLLVLSGLLASVLTGLALPIIVSTVPMNMATGVSTTASATFVFSEAMNPEATTVQFMDVSSFPPAFLAASPAWSSGNTVLTCTPLPAWPANKMIAWVVIGESPGGEELDGDTSGIFTTGDSGGGGVGCTNEVGSLTLGKGVLYRQTSVAAPILDSEAPYIFVACAAVACSNLPLTGISLDVPGGAVRNLSSTRPPDYYSYADIADSQAALESRYPNGNYLFTLQSAVGDLSHTVHFLTALTMPNAPRLTNFAAAQAVNPSQPFVLGWDAFSGVGADTCIQVEIYGEIFQTPSLGLPDALPGSARSVTIPAGTLQPDSAYQGAITFYNFLLSTNDYINLVYRSAVTEFSLVTGSGAPELAVQHGGGSIMISWPITATGCQLVEATSLAPGTLWQTVPASTYQTNDQTVFVTMPVTTSGSRFYRLETVQD